MALSGVRIYQCNMSSFDFYRMQQRVPYLLQNHVLVSILHAIENHTVHPETPLDGCRLKLA
jgi:hypothetical protein